MLQRGCWRRIRSIFNDVPFRLDPPRPLTSYKNAVISLQGLKMPKIAIIYASQSGKTKKMAEAIASGAKSVASDGGKPSSRQRPMMSRMPMLPYWAARPITASHQDHGSIPGPTEKLDLKGKVGVAFARMGGAERGCPSSSTG